MRSIEIRQKRALIWTRMQELNDRAGDAPLTGDDLAAWDAARSEMDALGESIARAEYLEELHSTTDEAGDRALRTIRDRAGNLENAALGNDEAARMAAYAVAFKRWLSFGMGALGPDHMQALHNGVRDMTTLSDRELRDMGIANQTAGGFLVPDGMMQAIEKALLFFGGMRQVATVFPTTDGALLPFPTVNDTSNVGERVAENQTVGSQDASVGIRNFQAFMYSSKQVPISWQLLQDRPDVESMIANLLGERIGRIQNTEFTTYGAADGPQGITVASTLGKTAAAVGAVTADELIDLIHSVDIAYRNMGCRFMGHDNTWRDIMKLKDGEGDYLVGRDLTTGEPSNIWGYPWTVNNDMATMATGAIAIEFGLLSKYHIRDVKGFTLLRLNELGALKLQSIFLGFQRADGALIDAGGNPVKHLVMA